MNRYRLFACLVSLVLLIPATGCGSRNRCCGPKPSCAPPPSNCCPAPGGQFAPPPPSPSPSGISGF